MMSVIVIMAMARACLAEARSGMRERRRMGVFVHAELRRGDAGFDHAIDRHVPPFDGQAAEGALQLLERQARVEQGAEDHVPRRARETIEVQNLQSAPSALKLKYFPSSPRMM